MQSAPGGLHPISSYSSQKQTTTSRIEMKASRRWIDWEGPGPARPPDHALQQHFSSFCLEGMLGPEAVCRLG